MLKNVSKAEYVGACRYTGYQAKSIRLTLECGHENFRKASQGIPERAKCRECARAADAASPIPHNRQAEP